MAFETSDKSGLNNGRKQRLDISNINQSGLKGDTVYTDEELLQLIIDNVSNIEVPVGTQDANQDGKVDVNDLIFNVSEAFKRYANTQSDKVTLPNLIESLTNGVTVLHNDLSVQKKISEGLQKKLDESNKREQGEKNPVIYSSGLVEQNKLHPIETVVRATEKEFVEQKAITGDTTKLSKAISHEPADIQSPIVEYIMKVEKHPKTLAETVANLWVLVTDLRMAVRSIAYDMDTAYKVARMGGVRSFFIHGPECQVLLQNARGMDTKNSLAVDAWNETGRLFDPSVPAYSSNNPSPGSELLPSTWYAVIDKNSSTIGKYSSTIPHWVDVATACPAKKAEYTESQNLDDLL